MFPRPTSDPSFQGDVYQGLDAENLRLICSNALKTVCGFCRPLWILRPFDLAQPYRLEMGTSIETPKGKPYALLGQ